MVIPPFEVLRPEQLRRRTSIKWQYYGPDVLPVWVAEMDVLLAPEVVEALTEAVRAGDTGYPNFGTTYKEAFSEFAPTRWGWAPDPADMVPVRRCHDRDPGPGRAVLSAARHSRDPESGLSALRQLHPGDWPEGGGGRAHGRGSAGRGRDRRGPGREPDRCGVAAHRPAPVQPAQPDRGRPHRCRAGCRGRVRAASRSPRHRGRGARAAGPAGCDLRALVRGRRPRLRGHLSGQGLQPRRPQGGADRRRSDEPRPAEAPARLRGLRRQPPGRDRARRGLPVGPVVAGRREREHRHEPGAAGRAPRRTPARGALPGPGRRPTSRGWTCGVSASATTPPRSCSSVAGSPSHAGPPVRSRRHRARPAQPRLLPGGAHRGGGPDGGRGCRPCRQAGGGDGT